ncbi:TRAP transporter substrate-binding protein [Dissulfurirhabdus thermomarina]|uniref:TRAP transporter substrate-binding protein n=1 Tax=Dissulfurirhabdus thermomarina TaxID=1765737 RepID=A0A6N9TPA2_DISTH|nr:TRAP transporter substrate-binding protein [Dissulfurirhabdus thermomarina]NDY41923.1 TRAP transporter substrate-binding protein [Dissulfurirhabdus thermomarina]NMX23109.1 TRAP transporter substrate-binding protein [Dissulfurirhabdus thermomarina]
MDRRTFLKTAGAAAVAAAGAAPAVHAGGRRLWRMVTAWPPGMPILQTGAEGFARRVSELTGGRLTIQVFAGGELIPPLEVFDAVSQGTVQCGHGAAYYWAGKEPAFQWFTSVPFGLNGQGMNTWLYEGGGLELWEKVYAPYNLVPRPCGNTGVQMGGWFNREIRRLADFKGLKMRIPGLGGRVFARAGGTVVLLPGGEIYTSLERGVIDATEWVGPYHDMRMGFHRIAKYYYGPGWHEPGSTLELIVHRPAYEALPADMKAAVDAAAAEANLRMLAEFEARNAEALAAIRKEGKVAVRTFPADLLEALRKLSNETLEEEAGKNPVTRKVHAAFTAFRRRWRAWEELSEGAYYRSLL